MLLHERIQQVMQEKQIRQVDLATATGKSKAAASKWLTGENIPKTDSLRKIADLLGVTEDWLLHGGETEQHSFECNIINKTAKLAPVLSWVQAGNFTNVQSVDMSQIEEWLPIHDECDDCFYLKVQGFSNYPMFHEGDYILVDPTVQYSDMQSGDIIVVRNGEGATFKRLVIEPNNHRYLQALNPDFKPNIIPLDEECVFVGEVVDSIRYIYQSKRRAKNKYI